VLLYRYFVSQSSEFCRHNPLYCVSTSVYCCKDIFRYRLSPETFGYTLVNEEGSAGSQDNLCGRPIRHSCRQEGQMRHTVKAKSPSSSSQRHSNKALTTTGRRHDLQSNIVRAFWGTLPPNVRKNRKEHSSDTVFFFRKGSYRHNNIKITADLCYKMYISEFSFQLSSFLPHQTKLISLCAVDCPSPTPETKPQVCYRLRYWPTIWIYLQSCVFGLLLASCVCVCVRARAREGVSKSFRTDRLEREVQMV
jgi:hypothetical protein